MGMLADSIQWSRRALNHDRARLIWNVIPPELLGPPEGVYPNRITTMTLNETLKQLQALGNTKVRAQNAKSGAGDNQFGVSLGDIG